ncbi:MAG: hypothetical protein JWP27_1366 [Flaviaesturariibacter sp.]|nr:hypothetical protein [Flaviaesturariibacter sp.]
MSRVLHAFLTLLLLTVLLVACNTAKSPKEVSSAFVKDLYTLKFDDAAAMTTDATRATLQKGRTELEGRGLSDEERSKRMEDQVATVFSTSNLAEHVAGESCVVQNEILTIPLRKEHGQWKVAATPDLVKDILYRQLYLENVRVAWSRLQDEYAKRAAIVQDYVAYRTSYGTATPGITAMSSLVQALAKANPATAAERAAFIAGQKKLAAQLDKNVQPSFTASSDLSLNYIIQLGSARDRIAEARTAYNDAARKARVKEFLPVAD